MKEWKKEEKKTSQEWKGFCVFLPTLNESKKNGRAPPKNTIWLSSTQLYLRTPFRCCRPRLYAAAWKRQPKLLTGDANKFQFKLIPNAVYCFADVFAVNCPVGEPFLRCCCGCSCSCCVFFSSFVFFLIILKSLELSIILFISAVWCVCGRVTAVVKGGKTAFTWIFIYGGLHAHITCNLRAEINGNQFFFLVRRL